MPSCPKANWSYQVVPSAPTNAAARTCYSNFSALPQNKFITLSMAQSKKKRTSGMFDFQNMQSKFQEERRNLYDVRERLKAVNEIDLARLMSDACALTEDEALQLLASKLSIEGLLNLRDAIQHVPNNIPRIVNGISLRIRFMFKTFESLPLSHLVNMSISDFQMYVKFVETYCPMFIAAKKPLADHLWKLTQTEDLPFNKFITPPLARCFQCEKDLTVRNNPSRAKVFTLDGPIPCTKITLECRSCSYVYGVCNYSDESGSHFYPKSDEYDVELIEVSNVTYFDAKLYKWFPSLR